MSGKENATDDFGQPLSVEGGIQSGDAMSGAALSGTTTPMSADRDEFIRNALN